MYYVLTVVQHESDRRLAMHFRHPDKTELPRQRDL